MPAIFHVTQKALLVHDDHLLVLHDRVGQHGDLPGGRLDDGELHGDLRAALMRELREELGAEIRVSLECEPRFWFKHHVRSAGLDAIGLAWVGAIAERTVTLSPEHDGCAWVPLETMVPEAHFVDHQRDAVARFLRDWRVTHGRV